MAEKKEIKKDYTLTEEEYILLCNNFYQMQSMVRILRYGCNTGLIEEEKEEVPDPLDVSNFAEALLEKLKVIEPLLGK